MLIPERYAPSTKDRAQLCAEGYPINSITFEVIRRKMREHINELRRDNAADQNVLDLIEGLLYLNWYA